MPKFSRIYLDTNVLRKSKWPEISVALVNLLSLASSMKVRVFLPVAVELEIEEHWIREFRRVTERAQRDASKLPTTFQRGLKIEVASMDDGRREFRTLTERNILSFGIERVPFSSRSLKDLFQQAIHHTPPFSERGTGFQDAVILQSIIEHLSGVSESAALVTSDNDFTHEIISHTAGSAGVELHCVPFDAILDKLTNEWTNVEKVRLWEREIQSATRAVNAMRSELEEFIAAQCREGFGMLSTLEKLTELQSVHILEISAVTTPIPELGKAKKSVEFSFKVTGEIQGVIEPSGFALEMARLLEFRHSAWKTDIARTYLEVTATADVENGEYRNVRFLSVRCDLMKAS